MTLSDYKKAIFNIQNSQEFDKLAFWAYQYQRESNPVFGQWLSFFSVQNQRNNFKFLPIEFFKNKTIKDNLEHKIIFTSSGTTGAITSSHFVADVKLYETSFIKAFEIFYGKISDYNILALLPAYLERKGSSLVYMAEKMIQLSGKKASGFYLNNYEELFQNLKTLEAKGEKSLLLGVSFALWDLAEQFSFDLKNTIVMETGGMKGRRPEIIREELHEIYRQGFGEMPIHSEYGMTELLSQAYSKGKSVFACPPWMKVTIRDINDPFRLLKTGETGAINIIDLANIHSCCFLATADIGKLNPNGTFEVLGRMDNSDIRGCNLMVGDY